MENLFTDKFKTVDNCHGGIGSILFHQLFNDQNGNQKIDFIDMTIIPSGSSIGLHQHGNDMETYIVLEGQGLMSVNGEEFPIKKGAIITNKLQGTHGLINNSPENIFLLVFQRSEK